MRGLATLALVVALGALAGCGEEEVPVVVKFDPTIKDLLLAKCVRCHGAGGKLSGDPASMNGQAPGNGYFTQYEDSGDCGAMMPVDCRHGAYTERGLIGYYVHAKDDERMPPLPSPRLTDRELELIDRWTANPLP
jgi:hypothetical protein